MGILNVEKIEALRERRGWTQEQAAGAAGLKGKQQWNNIVRGGNENVTLETLSKIAEALGVKAKDLLK